jgi:hypothetical protein
MNVMHTTLALLLACGSSLACATPLPEEVAAADQKLVATLEAQGAQLYQCRPDAGGKLGWTFREPIATLMLDGKTVGRHYAGPVWELADGSRIVAKVAGRAPGATPADIPLLRLEVSKQDGTGALAGVTTVQRLATRGGVQEGACTEPGALRAVPYAATYTFLRKGD